MRIETSTRGRAVFSDDGRYRYALCRWTHSGLLQRRGPMLFCMLNPSTADAFEDDPTVRRCIGFAEREGASQILVWNLYAVRSTDPSAVRLEHAVDHPELEGANDATLAGLLATSDQVVVAWGAHAAAGRVADVWPLLAPRSPVCLGLTKAGAPRHPLYLPKDAPMRSWRPS